MNGENINEKTEAALRAAGVSLDDELCFEPIREHALGFAPFAEVDDISDYYDTIGCYIRTVALSFCRRGVKFVSLDGVVISPFAKIGEGTVIYPGVQIRHGVEIGKNCVIGASSVLERCKIGDGCNLDGVRIYDSVLEDNVKIGPFCHIRPGSRICSGVKIGDFVEVKNSTLGRDTHASHLTYIGDSDVGERVNFGCGTVTVNYDGKNKHRAVIGNDAFIGCNTNLVSPVHIGDGGYTAAGSTITDDVPEMSLGIARARQCNKEGWVHKKHERDAALEKERKK